MSPFVILLFSPRGEHTLRRWIPDAGHCCKRVHGGVKWEWRMENRCPLTGNTSRTIKARFFGERCFDDEKNLWL